LSPARMPYIMGYRFFTGCPQFRPFQENKSPKNGQFSEEKVSVWEALISGTTLILKFSPRRQ
jgi:hypothetical protein